MTNSDSLLKASNSDETQVVTIDVLYIYIYPQLLFFPSLIWQYPLSLTLQISGNASPSIAPARFAFHTIGDTSPSSATLRLPSCRPRFALLRAGDRSPSLHRRPSPSSKLLIPVAITKTHQRAPI